MDNKEYIVAEAGCNHMGNFEIAKEMIMVAATFCKVDAIKFQKRTNRELLSEKEYNQPHPIPRNSFGSTYGEHREYLEFSQKQHRDLMLCCAEYGIEYSSSVWDLRAAKEIAELNPKFIKIPSACNLNFTMLEYLICNYSGEIQLSLGMTTRAEENAIIEFFDKQNALTRLVLYSCTSGYPVPFEDICLLEIERLQSTYGQYIKSIGFSGHHLGIAADIAALTLGANYFERHFTLDRTWKGTDHAASLEPDALRRLARDIRNVKKALTYKSTDILSIEEEQRAKLKRL